MSISAKSVWFDEFNMWVSLGDARTLGVPLAWFPKLLHATPAQRDDFEISVWGIHWDALDEDISVVGLIAGRGDITTTLKQHLPPEGEEFVPKASEESFKELVTISHKKLGLKPPEWHR
jgi:hypothetical protein